MKKILFVAGILVVCSFSYAQKINQTDVPANVLAKFDSLFPGEKVKQWEKDGAKFEAEFEHNKVETSVVLSPTGKLIETETAIPITELPAAATAYVKANYPSEKIKEASKIVYANKKVRYEAEIKGADLIFDDKGIFIKKNEGSGVASKPATTQPATKPASTPSKQEEKK